MSTPRAIRPLFGVGSRLIVDQFIPKSAVIAAIAGTARGVPKKQFFCHSRAALSPTEPRRPPISTCYSWQHEYTSRRQQLRFSSSTSKPPNDDDGNSAYKSPTPPSFSSYPTPTDTADNTQTTPIDQPKVEQEQDRSPPHTLPPTSDPDLPSAQNSRRSALNQSLSSFMDRAQTKLFAASQRINDLTGYSSIESLKSQISALESQLHSAQTHLTSARSAYKTAVSDRSTTQREVTTLLARQKTWTPLDFERFTTLYRQDYELEASVGARAAELEQAEREAERLGRELGAGILARYHEEQIWSDKIRRMSTWGTWGLMGVNILLFLLLQFGAEPWRRRRLVRGFEEKVREALADERVMKEETGRVVAAAVAPAAVGTTTATFTPVVDSEAKTPSEQAEGEPVFMAAPDVAVPGSGIPVSESPVVESPPESAPPRIISWREALRDRDLNYLRAVLLDLISDRKITLRMRDISLIAVEGAVAGATIAMTMAILLFRRS
ncbi:Mdm33 family-domain-containing protein [Nemania sp. FL0031]|nr:Mdm33 family-domain-containing protein [Nemania sp. FL0031]